MAAEGALEKLQVSWRKEKCAIVAEQSEGGIAH